MIKKKDLKFGFKNEKDAHPILEETFGILKNTKDYLGKSFEFDKFNDKYYIELKSRIINHNKYNSLYFGKNKFDKGNQLLEDNPKLRIFYIWKCYDGYYYWEHDSSPYRIKTQGRCDRGKYEYNDCIDIENQYINSLGELSIN